MVYTWNFDRLLNIQLKLTWYHKSYISEFMTQLSRHYDVAMTSDFYPFIFLKFPILADSPTKLQWMRYAEASNKC